MDTSETYKNSIVNPTEPMERVERVKWYEDPVYIKMCDCEEIQKGHRFGESDFIALFEHIKGVPLPRPREWQVYSYCDGYRPDGEPQVWLPRQDQLQEMVGNTLKDYWYCESDNPAIALLCGLWGDVIDRGDFYGDRVEEYYQQFISMEQLWLAFVMRDRYGKIWSGSEWIKDK